MLDPILQLKSRVDFLESRVADQDQKLLDQEHKFKNIIAQRDLKILILEEKYALAMTRRFMRSAESFARQESFVFDEPEANLDPQAEMDLEPEITEVAAHTRIKLPRKRAELPEGLEVVPVIHELPASELIGPNGEQFTEIGREVSEKLDVVPMDLRIIQHIRIKYAVKGREELGVRTAPLPAQIIPKGIATPGLLAHIAQAKYEHHLPLNRQEKIWADLGVHMPRNSMCQWMMKVGESVKTLCDYLFEDMKLEKYLHADETRVTLLQDPNKEPDHPSHQGYMWVYVNKTGVRYDYRSSREGKHPLDMLENFTGHLQVDGYSGYDRIFIHGMITEVGCMAHLRRKFTDIQKAEGKKAKLPIIKHVLELIQKLYHIEKVAKEQGLDPEGVYQLRQEKSKPILEALHAYIKDQNPKVPPKLSTARALQYALNHWVPISRYLDSGILDIDNNAAERAIRPFTIGRKNWTFCGNVRGADAAANIYSLIESAKIHDLKIFEYLKYVFEEIPKADTPKKLEALLPKQVAESKPEFKKIIKIKPPKK